MRILPSLVAALPLLAPLAAGAQSTPVVLELYTSQGCSSCPPADALLTELARRDGVIALALHVDYWDYLGWKDPYGSAAFSDRQRAYAKATKRRTIFTPEMIVQGDDPLRGYDADAIEARIARHREQPPAARLDLRRDGGTLVIKVGPEGAGTGPAEVHVVRFIPSERVDIDDGENAGQSITYTNIVTDWRTVGGWDGKSPLELHYAVDGEGPLAVIVQADDMGPVLTAAELR